MGNSIKITIGSESKNYVDKFEIKPQPGTDIEVEAEAGYAAAIAIPNANTFLENAESDGYIQVIVDNNNPQVFRVKSEPSIGHHYYHVFMITQQEFADNPGSSAPKIVIE
jgi:hypothetical protein